MHTVHVVTNEQCMRYCGVYGSNLLEDTAHAIANCSHVRRIRWQIVTKCPVPAYANKFSKMLMPSLRKQRLWSISYHILVKTRGEALV
jgi:hypothetical protein